MQDLQNIPNPDVDSFENQDDFGSHSDMPPVSRGGDDARDSDVERPAEDIPVPPDDPRQTPIEEPPGVTEQPPIEEDTPKSPQLV